MSDLQRFIDAQKAAYPLALAEIKKGKKTGHWMWYIFPQIQGLGLSETTRFNPIKDRTEAEALLEDPVLGKRLIEISNALLELETKDAHGIFGSPDDSKLKSCMTLFSQLNNTDPVFQLVLNKFFQGNADEKTLQLLDT